jgi:hypothetical protein
MRDIILEFGTVRELLKVNCEIMLTVFEHSPRR